MIKCSTLFKVTQGRSGGSEFSAKAVTLGQFFTLSNLLQSIKLYPPKKISQGLPLVPVTVTLFGNRAFADVIILRISREHYSELNVGPKSSDCRSQVKRKKHTQWADVEISYATTSPDMSGAIRLWKRQRKILHL